MGWKSKQQFHDFFFIITRRHCGSNADIFYLFLDWFHMNSWNTLFSRTNSRLTTSRRERKALNHAPWVSNVCLKSPCNSLWYSFSPIGRFNLWTGKCKRRKRDNYCPEWRISSVKFDLLCETLLCDNKRRNCRNCCEAPVSVTRKPRRRWRLVANRIIKACFEQMKLSNSFRFPM